MLDSIEQLITFPRETRVRSRDSIIIPLMMAENRVSFSLFHFPVEQVVPQGHKGLIAINLCDIQLHLNR